MRFKPSIRVAYLLPRGGAVTLLVAALSAPSSCAWAQEVSASPSPASTEQPSPESSGVAAAASDSGAETGSAAQTESGASPTATQADTSPSSEAGPQPYPTTIPVKVAEKEEPLPRDSQGASVLQEVVVTAQKFKQSVKDVPISMSVLSDKFVAEHGIVDIVQAMQYVPNVKISSGGFFAAPQARGFSFNNNNKAFESPLGIAFDGIPYTNTTYFNSGLFDIQRIEVMRGPQGTTFGKNTTAGLVSIITADPTSNFSGVASVQGGQFGRKHVELAFAGPLWADVVDFRIAGVYDDNKGFVHNTTGEIVPGVPTTLRGYSHKGYRAKLKFPDLLGTDLKLQYESVDLNNSGAGIEIWKAGETVKADARKYDPNADFELGNNITSLDGPDYRLAHTNTFLAEWNVPLGEWTITGLGGHSELKETIGVDVDFAPVPGLNGYGRDRFPTTSFELRAKSPLLDGLFGLNNIFGIDLGHTDFLGGFFYQRRSIRDSSFDFVLNDGPFLEMTGAAYADFYGNSTPPIPGTVTDLIALPAGIINPLEAQGRVDDFEQFFDQTGSVIALFQQTEWKFLPKWVLQLGLRASRERKTGYWNLVFNSPPPYTVLTALGLQQFTAVRSIEETQYQPKVSLNYQPTRKVSLFAHWTRGFKGGGFNAFAYRPDEDDLVFKPETTTEWGFDLKTSFLGGVIRPNISLYRMDARNFQVLGREKPPVVSAPGICIGATCVPPQVCSDTTCLPPSVIGLGTTRVFNAAKAYAQGVEGDVTWMVWNGLSVLATVGYNDTKYVEFTQNECPASDSHPTCDATGRPFAFAPRWDATLTPSWIIPLPFFGLTVTPTFTAQYMSTQLLDTDLEEVKRQGGYMKYSATLGIGNLGQGWSLQVIGRNLADKATSVRYGDVFAGVLVSVPESPREIFAQFRWTF